MPSEYDDPKVTIRLLEELMRKGFGDKEFSKLHHFAKRGREVTIASHLQYCRTIQRFRRGGNNWSLQKALEEALRSYQRKA